MVFIKFDYIFQSELKQKPNFFFLPGVTPLSVSWLSFRNRPTLMRLTSMMMRMKIMKTRDRRVSDTHNRPNRNIWSWFKHSWRHVLFMNMVVLLAFTEVPLEQKTVPTAVFGGLKDDWKRPASKNFSKYLCFLNSLLDPLYFKLTGVNKRLAACVPISIFFIVEYMQVWACINIGHVVSVFSTIELNCAVWNTVMCCNVDCNWGLIKFDFANNVLSKVNSKTCWYTL